MTTATWRVVLAVLVLSAAQQARADGCFVKRTEVGQSKSLVSSPKQEAILATDGWTVQVILRTHFNAGPKELCWIIPVPAVPEDVGKADDAIFDKLEALTVPTFTKVDVAPQGDSGGFGCGVKANHLGRSAWETPMAVQVEKAGSAGIFDFQVVSAKRAEDLLQWLKAHNYSPPEGAAKAFEPYVASGWHWLTVRVRAEEADRPTLAPHPITYRYKSLQLVFPLIISSLSAAKETEIVLHVVANEYFIPSRWARCTSQDLAFREEKWPLAEQKGSPSGTNYEELLRRKTRELSGRLLVTEFAQRWQLFGSSASMGRRFDDVLDPKLVESIGALQTLTRLRALVRREQMDEDIELGSYRSGRPEDNHIQFRAPPPHAASAGAPVKAGGTLLSVGILSACAAGGLGRAHGRRTRALSALLAGLALAALAVI